MDISDLITKLEDIKAKHGDIEVVTYDYTGCDHEEHEPLCSVKTDWNYRKEPVAVLNA